MKKNNLLKSSFAIIIFIATSVNLNAQQSAYRNDQLYLFQPIITPAYLSTLPGGWNKNADNWGVAQQQ